MDQCRILVRTIITSFFLYQYWIFKRYHLHHHPWSRILNPAQEKPKNENGCLGRLDLMLSHSGSGIQFWIKRASRTLIKWKLSISAKFSASVEDSFCDFWTLVDEDWPKAEVTVSYHRDGCTIGGLAERNA